MLIGSLSHFIILSQRYFFPLPLSGLLSVSRLESASAVRCARGRAAAASLFPLTQAPLSHGAALSLTALSRRCSHTQRCSLSLSLCLLWLGPSCAPPPPPPPPPRAPPPQRAPPRRRDSTSRPYSSVAATRPRARFFELVFEAWRREGREKTRGEKRRRRAARCEEKEGTREGQREEEEGGADRERRV